MSKISVVKTNDKKTGRPTHDPCRGKEGCGLVIASKSSDYAGKCIDCDKELKEHQIAYYCFQTNQ